MVKEAKYLIFHKNQGDQYKMYSSKNVIDKYLVSGIPYLSNLFSLVEHNLS
jgi:hypothetical protein